MHWAIIAFIVVLHTGIRAAAVLDSREDRLIGVITVSDFMNVFCHLHETDPDGEPNVALAHMTIAQWKGTCARCFSRGADACGDAHLHDIVQCCLLQWHSIGRPLLYMNRLKLGI